MISAEFESKRTQAKRWIDDVIKHREALRNLGCRDATDLNIVLCSGYGREILFHNGLEKLALYLGLTIKYNPNWSPTDNYCKISCEYGGYILEELWVKS